MTDELEAAIAAAKSAQRPLYAPSGLYRHSRTLDLRCTLNGAKNAQSDDFKGLVGDGIEATVFECTDPSIPAMRISGRYFWLIGFTARHTTIPTAAQTLGDVIRAEDWVFFAKFDQLQIENGYVGLHNTPGERVDIGASMFSCEFGTIRFRNNRYVHWIDGDTGGATTGGTGNSARNIYMDSPGVDRMFRAYQRFAGFGGHIAQLNVEQTTFEDSAVYDTGGNGLLIDSLHFEGNRFPCGSGARAFVASNTQGALSIRGLNIDECHIGPLKVATITRTGTTARVSFDFLDKPLGGHPFRAGDTVVLDGADQADYVGPFVVTAVPSTSEIEFTVSGSAATPATVASDSEYITAALGSAISTLGIEIVKALADCEVISVDGLRIRDVRVTGKNSAARATTFRFASGQATNARVRINNLTVAGQMANASILGGLEIVGLSRTSNVATAYTRTPHRLRTGQMVFVVTGHSGFQLARSITVASPVSFTYSSTGADAPLFRASASSVLCKTYGTVTKSRTSGLATITLDADHALQPGHRVRVANMSGSGGTFSGTDLSISGVAGRDVSYKSAGTDEGPTADTGGVVMVLDAGISSQYLTEPSSSIVLEQVDYLLSGCDVLDFGSVAAGATATLVSTHYGARVGDRIDSNAVAQSAGLEISASVTATDTITWYARNMTAGAVSAVQAVRYQVSR